MFARKFLAHGSLPDTKRMGRKHIEMSDQQQGQPVVEDVKAQEPATASAGTKKADNESQEIMIPKHRYDEVAAKLAALEKDAAAKAKAQQTEDERKLQEQQQWQQLADQRKAKIDELTPQVELATKLTELVLAQYAAEIKDWPEQVKAMAPGDDTDVLIKLDWMSKAKPLALALMEDKTPPAGNSRRPQPVATAGTGAKQEEARGNQAAWTRRTF